MQKAAQLNYFLSSLLLLSMVSECGVKKSLKRMRIVGGGVREGAQQAEILMRFQNYCLFSLHKSCKDFL